MRAATTPIGAHRRFYDVHLITPPINTPSLYFWYNGTSFPLYLSKVGVLSDKDIENPLNVEIGKFPICELYHKVKGSFNGYVASRVLSGPIPTNVLLLERWMNNISDSDLRKYIGIWRKCFNNEVLASACMGDVTILEAILLERYHR